MQNFVQHFDIQNVLPKSKFVFGVYNELIQILYMFSPNISRAPAWAVFPELSACFCYSCHYLNLRAFFSSNEFIVRHLYCHKLSVQMSCTTYMQTERRIKTHYCLSSFMVRRPFARYFCWGCCWQSCGNCWISTRKGPARKVVSPGEILMLSCCSLWRLVDIWCFGRGFSKDEMYEMFGSGVVGLGKIQADKYILNHIIELF